MAIELPASPKVYTTKYTNFKGVDFTNDPTNVWYRRSPDAVNMLPDASGRPFKRHGWNILLSNADLCDALGVYEYDEVSITEEEFNMDKTHFFTLVSTEYVRCTEEDVWDENEPYYIRKYSRSLTINKCAYFELAGVDHIVVFTDAGVIFYNGEVTDINTDLDCYTGFDRCFFFEGDGTSAFYIYGNFKVWRYEADFQIHDVTSQVTTPTILISTEADCVGTAYDGYNILGTMASIEYCATELYTYWCSDDLKIVVPSDLKSSLTLGKIYRYTWNGSAWIDTNLTGKAFNDTGIQVIGTQVEDDEIIVLYMNGVLLPNNVSDRTAVSVWASTDIQFDTPLNVININTPSSGEVRLWTDDTLHREKGRAWLEFGDLWTSLVDVEDYIKVTFPSVEVDMTQFTDKDSITTTANLVGA